MLAIYFCIEGIFAIMTLVVVSVILRVLWDGYGFGEVHKDLCITAVGQLVVEVAVLLLAAVHAVIVVCVVGTLAVGDPGVRRCGGEVIPHRAGLVQDQNDVRGNVAGDGTDDLAAGGVGLQRDVIGTGILVINGGLVDCHAVIAVIAAGIGITGGTGRGAPGGGTADRGQEGGHVGEIHGGVVDGGAAGVRGTLGIGDAKDQTGHQGQQHGDRQHQRHKGVSLHMPHFFHVPHLLNPVLASPAPPER